MPASQILRLLRQTLTASPTGTVGIAGTPSVLKCFSRTTSSQPSVTAMDATAATQNASSRDGKKAVVPNATAIEAVEPAIRIPTTVPIFSLG